MKWPNVSKCKGFPCGSAGKESACECRRWLIPGSGKSPGEGNGNSLQYFCLENSMDRRSWQATGHGVTNVGHGCTTSTSLHFVCSQLKNKMSHYWCGIIKFHHDWPDVTLFCNGTGWCQSKALTETHYKPREPFVPAKNHLVSSSLWGWSLCLFKTH